jgi:hypothetical protein
MRIFCMFSVQVLLIVYIRIPLQRVQIWNLNMKRTHPHTHTHCKKSHVGMRQIPMLTTVAQNQTTWK